MGKPSAIVIGAGIVGLATARALALKGYAVRVFDRSPRAIGASVRNFGMVWPVGQPSGTLYNRACRSRDIWKEIGDSGAFWYRQTGSLHLAYHADEWQVLEELQAAFAAERGTELLTAAEVEKKSGAVVTKGLIGGLYCPQETIVDPREAIGALPGYLSEKWDIEFNWNTCATYIADHTVYTGRRGQHEADIIFVCSGADFETLYPEAYAEKAITRCKLQMMRLASQPDNWSIGPSLCGGLSLIHYKSFEAATSLAALKKRYESEMAEYLKWGIHVMVSQNGSGELTIGDSHEYGLLNDPFDRAFINEMIVDYLNKFATFRNWDLTQSWHGIYAKCTDGATEVFFSPSPGVYILNGLGGAGMTLSFGLAEEKLAEL